ncbi:MAG: hypothetical protein LBH24_06120 [Clostridiales bacterium]|nr:hypothetical protein [Clostridiales bacterium]
MKKYYLGVDGGNTKTLYLLFDESGGLIDYIKIGSCSHEAIGGFKAAEEEMSKQIRRLIKRNGLSIDLVETAVFGLAGADFDWQKQCLRRSVEKIGLKRIIMDNDGFLALKAGSIDGTGVCNINGTGSVSVGVNEKGESMQVGGIGDISSDYAGGYYIALCGLRAVFDQLYRCGGDTVLRELVFDELKIGRVDDFAEAAVKSLKNKDFVLKMNLMMEHAAADNDACTIRIIEEIGRGQGHSVAGLIRRLRFERRVHIILAGSVWAGEKFPQMQAAFSKTVAALTENDIDIEVLKIPPAAGAVIWAFEERIDQNIRDNILENVGKIA